MRGTMKFGEYLVSQGLLSDGDVNIALKKQSEAFGEKYPLGNYILALNMMSEYEICNTLSQFEGTDFQAIGDMDLNMLPKEYLREVMEETKGYKVIPLGSTPLEASFATLETDPLRLGYVQMKLKGIHAIANKKITIVRALEQSFTEKMRSIRNILTSESEVSSAYQGISITMVDKVKQAFRKAIAINATDLRFDILDNNIYVSIEKFGRKIPLNFNIEYGYKDNIWRTLCGLAGVSHNTLTPGGWSDIAIDDIFDDGKYSTRISLLDTIRGVCVTARIIPSDNHALPVEGLGLTKANEDDLIKVVNFTAGVGYITGPMGSGKNTTAYSILERIVKEQRHCMSIEDPVEIRVPGINQVEVNLNTLDWENADQAILRTMSKVLFVGETRESACVRMSTRLANSSVMVMSTLHVDIVAEVFSRLRGLVPNIDGVVSALQFLTNQRMLPSICEECRIQVPLDTLPKYHQQLLKSYGYSGKVYQARKEGCPKCSQGLNLTKVVIVMEQLHLDYEIKSLLHSKDDLDKEDVVKRYMFQRCKTIGHDALIHMHEGRIALDSIMRDRLLELY